MPMVVSFFYILEFCKQEERANLDRDKLTQELLEGTNRIEFLEALRPVGETDWEKPLGETSREKNHNRRSYLPYRPAD